MMTLASRAPGDEIVPDANMVFDHATRIDAKAEQIWPWLVQLGKQRAGWYLPRRVERLLPRSRRALRVIEPRWQMLEIGERIPDYGGRHEWLEVARLTAPHELVYRSERRGRVFSWALVLAPIDEQQTTLRLRFRGQIRSRGLTRMLIVAVGGFFDWSTGQLMIHGLRERLATTVRCSRPRRR